VSDRVVAAIDQGTTSTRCLLFNRAGRMLAVAQVEHRQYFPRPGWVEHDAEEIWRNVTRVVPAALRSAGLGPENIVALGIANQRETTVVWDRTPARRWPGLSPGRTPAPTGSSPASSGTEARRW
jgi:glycerol kinase